MNEMRSIVDARYATLPPELIGAARDNYAVKAHIDWYLSGGISQEKMMASLVDHLIRENAVLTKQAIQVHSTTPPHNIFFTAALPTIPTPPQAG